MKTINKISSKSLCVTEIGKFINTIPFFLSYRYIVFSYLCILPLHEGSIYRNADNNRIDKLRGLFHTRCKKYSIYKGFLYNGP